ncbi:MAG: hypothetical protein EOM69_10965 [Clostridia bacterium]|nr:hypothetical protein [Clostridia bacterium]
MYNRYMNSGGFEDYFEPQPRAQPYAPQQPLTPLPPLPPAVDAFSVATEEAAAPPASAKSKGGITSTIKNLLGNNLKLPEIDADTILLLVVAYFLIADSDENISDTLLIIGALFLLGL